MMTQADFLKIMTETFEPFLSNLGFALCETVNRGRYCEMSFAGKKYTVRISYEPYEPGDDVFFVFVIDNDHSTLAEMDNPAITPRLADLNRRYMGSVDATERKAANDRFASTVARDSRERRLLRIAKDLYLVLPKYLADRRR